MKKLMFAAAAIAAGVAVADVTSANIVGYQTKTIETANQQEMVGATFVSVGGTALDIQDIVLVNDNEMGGSWIKWWDAENAVYSDQVGFWDDIWDAGDDYDSEDDDTDLEVKGWGDLYGYKVDHTFAPGEGFWFCPNKDDVGMTLAGEVVKSEAEWIGLTVEVANQQIMVINPFPAELDIQAIELEDDNEMGGSWVKWWDAENTVYSDQVGFWDDIWDAGDDYDSEDDDTDLEVKGWGDLYGYKVDHKFAPGDGFWFCPNKDGVTIKFKNPFYTAK